MLHRATPLVLLFKAVAVISSPINARQDSPLPFNWTSIKPSRDLEYHSCYETFRCARLEVPMDWTHASDDSIAIAIMTLPATVPVTDPSFGGTILMNPGGPGNAATTVMLSQGAMLQAAFDGERHFEILGFDPRGVGFTTPGLDCFGDEISRWIHTSAQQSVMGDLTQGNQNFLPRLAHAGGFNRMCEMRSGPLGNHVSTASVARDMLEIVDKVSEEKQRNGWSPSIPAEPPKLQFAGFSYGTFLGMTFASMFPNRVSRMLLDGVVDVEDYVSYRWRFSINDAEESLHTFYRACFDLGARCPLFRANDTDWTAMQARVHSMISKLGNLPATLIHENNVFLISPLEVGTYIRATLTGAHTSSFRLATGLSQFLTGNFSALSTVITEPRPDDSTPVGGVPLGDARGSIGCSDVLPEHYSEVTALTTDFLEAGLADLQDQSPTMGASWALLMLDCVGRKQRPPYAFSGPWAGTAAPTNTTSAGAPILFISSTLDPSTPLRNAYNMAKRFPGAAVAEQEAVGHSAIFSAPSKCMANIVNRYFEKGVLPQNGTRCASDCGLFGECDSVLAGAQ